MTDAAEQEKRTYIGQGEFVVASSPNHVIATLLGSCVSACLWDSERAIGGMNHVVFSGASSQNGVWMGHGVNAMEILINELMRRGAIRSQLKAKVFGGAALINGLTRAGRQNGDFVVEFLDREGIACVGGDLGGQRPRRVEFWPATGRARMKYVNEEVVETAVPASDGHDIELF